MSYTVKHLDVDLYKFHEENFLFLTINFQICTQYVDPHTYDIIVRRIDNVALGWDEPLQILINNTLFNTTQIITVGVSSFSCKFMCMTSEHPIEPSDDMPVFIQYSLTPSPTHCIKQTRAEFNTLFNTDIVTLPANLYAVGLLGGAIYMYNEAYSQYHNIIACVYLLISVALTHGMDNFYFLVSSCDGYMEKLYQSNARVTPKLIQEHECAGMYLYLDLLPSEYAVYHTRKHILGQTHHKRMPYTLDIVDRHFLFHNLYNSFRSFHCGVAFRDKQSKIVFGGQNSRGRAENFVSKHTRTIGINPREYFKSASVPKDNILFDGWIDRKDMIHYKYILDIDGNASTWDATAWKLNSGSVIFKVKSGWKQWFYADYRVNIHYLEIEDDFSDIQEKFKWCESHESECLAMIRNCKALFQTVYRMDNIISHTLATLAKITAA